MENSANNEEAAEKSADDGKGEEDEEASGEEMNEDLNERKKKDLEEKTKKIKIKMLLKL